MYTGTRKKLNRLFQRIMYVHTFTVLEENIEIGALATNINGLKCVFSFFKLTEDSIVRLRCVMCAVCVKRYRDSQTSK